MLEPGNLPSNASEALTQPKTVRGSKEDLTNSDASAMEASTS